MNTTSDVSFLDSENRRIANVRNLAATNGLADLLPMLSDPSWVVRRAVVEGLVALKEQAVRPLCDVLLHQRESEAKIAAAVDALGAMPFVGDDSIAQLAASENPAIVADAAQILGRRREPSAIPILIQLTHHPDDNVAVGAIEALGKIGGRAAVEALITAVNSGSFFRTFPAIDVLGRSGDPRAVAPLARLLKIPSYRPEAARALSRTGDKSAIRPLLEELASPSDAATRIAAISIWDLREKFEEKSGGVTAVFDEIVKAEMKPETFRRLLAVLSGADAPEAVKICRLLGVLGSAEAIPRLAAALDSPGAVATAAAEALKKIGRSTDSQILEALHQGSSSRRKALLPLITNSKMLAGLIECLTDSDPEVRALACEALARVGATATVERIFQLLGDVNLRVVHAATSAMQALGSREARVLAIRGASAESAIVRRSCFRILAYFGDAEGLPAMLAGMQDKDARVREAAVQGLPFLESPLALEALFEAAKSPSARIRSLAMRALGQLVKRSERGISLLLKGLQDADAWVRYYSCQSLGRIGFAEAAAEIAALLEDESGLVRVSAVEALSRLESPEAQKALRTAAASEELEVKRAALVGLGLSHRDEDLPIVLAGAKHEDVPTRLMAISALVSFSSPVVVAALNLSAGDSDEQISSTAINFLAARPEQEATEALIERLVDEERAERAKAALLIPAEGRISGILTALETASDELASALVSVLMKANRPEARAALLAAVKSNNVAARKAALIGMASRPSEEITAVLKETTEFDPDNEVRQIANLLIQN